MKRIVQTVFLLAFTLPLFIGTCWGQSKAAAPAIDPQAEKILRALNDQKKKDIQASLEVFDTMDEVLKTGEKIQYSHVRKLKVSKPKQFWIESTGDITKPPSGKTTKPLPCLTATIMFTARLLLPALLEKPWTCWLINTA